MADVLVRQGNVNRASSEGDASTTGGTRSRNKGARSKSGVTASTSASSSSSHSSSNGLSDDGESPDMIHNPQHENPRDFKRHTVPQPLSASSSAKSSLIRLPKPARNSSFHSHPIGSSSHSHGNQSNPLKAAATLAVPTKRKKSKSSHSTSLESSIASNGSSSSHRKSKHKSKTSTLKTKPLGQDPSLASAAQVLRATQAQLQKGNVTTASSPSKAHRKSHKQPPKSTAQSASTLAFETPHAQIQPECFVRKVMPGVEEHLASIPDLDHDDNNNNSNRNIADVDCSSNTTTTTTNNNNSQDLKRQEPPSPVRREHDSVLEALPGVEQLVESIPDLDSSAKSNSDKDERSTNHDNDTEPKLDKNARRPSATQTQHPQPPVPRKRSNKDNSKQMPIRQVSVSSISTDSQQSQPKPQPQTRSLREQFMPQPPPAEDSARSERSDTSFLLSVPATPTTAEQQQSLTLSGAMSLSSPLSGGTSVSSRSSLTSRNTHSSSILTFKTVSSLDSPPVGTARSAILEPLNEPLEGSGPLKIFSVASSLLDDDDDDPRPESPSSSSSSSSSSTSSDSDDEDDDDNDDQHQQSTRLPLARNGDEARASDKATVINSLGGLRSLPSRAAASVRGGEASVSGESLPGLLDSSFSSLQTTDTTFARRNVVQVRFEDHPMKNFLGGLTESIELKEGSADGLTNSDRTTGNVSSLEHEESDAETQQLEVDTVNSPTAAAAPIRGTTRRTSSKKRERVTSLTAGKPSPTASSVAAAVANPFLTLRVSLPRMTSCGLQDTTSDECSMPSLASYRTNGTYGSERGSSRSEDESMSMPSLSSMHDEMSVQSLPTSIDANNFDDMDTIASEETSMSGRGNRGSSVDGSAAFQGWESTNSSYLGGSIHENGPSTGESISGTQLDQTQVKRKPADAEPGKDVAGVVPAENDGTGDSNHNGQNRFPSVEEDMDENSEDDDDDDDDDEETLEFDTDDDLETLEESTMCEDDDDEEETIAEDEFPHQLAKSSRWSRRPSHDEDSYGAMPPGRAPPGPTDALQQQPSNVMQFVVKPVGKKRKPSNQPLASSWDGAKHGQWENFGAAKSHSTKSSSGQKDGHTFHHHQPHKTPKKGILKKSEQLKQQQVNNALSLMNNSVDPETLKPETVLSTLSPPSMHEDKVLNDTAPTPPSRGRKDRDKKKGKGSLGSRFKKSVQKITKGFNGNSKQKGVMDTGLADRQFFPDLEEEDDDEETTLKGLLS